eukprot:g18330.t1
MKNANLEQNWITYDECSAHANCEAVFPFACQHVAGNGGGNQFDITRPAFKDGTAYDADSECNPYSVTKRQPMYCARECLTGGCGQYGDVVWGTTHANAPANGEALEAWTRSKWIPACRSSLGPCNGCLNAVTTFDLSACPAHCRTGIPPTVTLSAGEYTVEQNPNAIGGWTLDTWVKTFNYQFILKKSVAVKGNHPNHLWSGYETEKIEITNVDKYFPAACRNYDGVYASTVGAVDWASVQVFTSFEREDSAHPHRLILAVEPGVTGSTNSAAVWVLVVAAASTNNNDNRCYGSFPGNLAHQRLQLKKMHC